MKTGRIVMFVALLIGGFIGLAMTVCGGGFLFWMSGSGGGGGFFTFIPLASIAIGVTVIIAVLRGLGKLNKA